MEKIPNAVYTKELREEAVKLVKEGSSMISIGVYYIHQRPIVLN